MEQVCPLCNGMEEIHVRCSRCDVQMSDSGMVSDYVGPYSPYELTAHVKQENDGRCTHLLNCPQCGRASYAIVQSEWI
ncbi:MAG TPA: hypothetical protein VFV52_06345 [Bacilli bacterium]|nr:hypothetical protein [Bacilli bacterium]